MELVMAKKNPRFDLFAILEWTAAIAFLCALCAGAGGSSTWTWRFTSLPADDLKLRSWLDSQDRKDVIISRAGNTVTLSSQTGIFAGIRKVFGIPNPPWQQLGYLSLQKMSGSAKWSIFRASPYLWLAGFGVLIALGLFRRRYIHRTQKLE
jgi:hypothetical protein